MGSAWSGGCGRRGGVAEGGGGGADGRRAVVARWVRGVAWRARFGHMHRVHGPWPMHVQMQMQMQMHHAPCTMHHAPCTMHQHHARGVCACMRVC